MIKIGDRVAPFDRMSFTGTVIDLIPYTTKTWLVGGSSGEGFKIRVKHDDKDQSILDYLVNDLMRVD